MDRHTRQRQAIRQVLEEADRPLGPQEIREASQAYAPGLGIATVYRTLRSLVNEGWLVSVELPGEPSRYEVGGKAHHHHFRCRRCARVYETHGCLTNLKQLIPQGFCLEAHEVVLYGVCTTCSRPT